MTTWVFQTNPKTFDIDAYLATDPLSMLWRARQRKNDLNIGDKVYIWRTIGGGDRKRAGLVAEARIASGVINQTDDAATLPYWHNASDASEEPRVEIVFDRIYPNPRLQWPWIEHDPVIGRFKQMQGTNFVLSEDEAERFRILVDRVSEDWRYPEAVAGLWAYVVTRGMEVSKLPGSPVSDAALRSGRVVTGMYNKVMNFRAIDPKDAPKGRSASSVLDREIWTKFHSSAIGDLDMQAIKAEYERLWPADSGIEPSPSPIFVAPADVDLANLLERWEKRASKPGSGGDAPKSYTSKTRRFERDELVYQIALVRAGGTCEVPDCSHPLFCTSNKSAFLEVHHIKFLSEGGPDSPDNTAAICPAHHREAHVGINARKIADELRKVRAVGSC